MQGDGPTCLRRGHVARRCQRWRDVRCAGCRRARRRADVPRQQQECRRAARRPSPTACGTSWSTASTSSIGSMCCTPKVCRHRRSLPASLPACTPTPTSSSPPVRTTRSSDSTSATATRRALSTGRGVVERRSGRRALPHRLQRVRGLQLRQGRRGDGRVRRAPRPARAGARRRPRRGLRRGRRGAVDHAVGQRPARRLPALGVRSRVSVEPGRAIVADAAITVTPSARSSTSLACVPTSRSTAA